MAEQIKKIHMGPAKCAVDLGDGSERGEYVNQDYILHTLGRPHRAINLMYCYYPLDKEWPGRISEVMKDAEVSFSGIIPTSIISHTRAVLTATPRTNLSSA